MRRLLAQWFSRERGQVLMIAAVLMPALLGMAGMAVDIGTYATERRSLQNAADSIALAAARDLPDSNAALAAADSWAAKNGISPSEVTVVIAGGDTAPEVTVTISRQHDFAFMRVLGVDNKQVGARAKAVKASFGGHNGIVPWTVTQDTIDAAGVGSLVTMKYDADGANIGNFGAIRIDGPGAATYNNSVRYGSTTFACAISAPNCAPGACPGVYPDTCAETSPECDGPDCQPQTGNLIGPTQEGVDYRMQYTSTSCDSFGDAFTPAGGGSYTLDPDCNPWIDGPGRCDSTTDYCSRRVIMIPVVDDFGSGASDPATIQRFALVYLMGYEAGKCQGNACEIQGYFVKADFTTGALGGTYDPDALVHFAKLVE